MPPSVASAAAPSNWPLIGPSAPQPPRRCSFLSKTIGVPFSPRRTWEPICCYCLKFAHLVAAFTGCSVF